MDVDLFVSASLKPYGTKLFEKSDQSLDFN